MVCEDLVGDSVMKMQMPYPGLAIEADCLAPRLGGFDVAGPVVVPLDSLCFFIALPDDDVPSLAEAVASSGL